MTVTIDDITTHVRYVDVVYRNVAMGAAEYSGLRTDMDTILATPIPETIGGLSDVDTTTTPPVDSDTLVWDSTANDGAGAFVPATPPSGPIVRNGDDSVHIANATAIIAQAGVTTVTNASFPDYAYIEPQYGGTGSKNLVPHSDHTHTTPTTTPVTYTAKGTLSSGSVTLVTTNVTLPAAWSGEAAKVYTVTVRLNDTERGNGGSSYYTQAITINGNTRTSIIRQCVGGVPRSVQHTHSQTITGTGAAITVSAALTFDSGDPLTVDAGEIIIDVDCNR